jgi:putative acetyltransferase
VPAPTIRTTTAVDHDTVIDLVRTAFTNGGHDGQEEVDIVLDTWERDASPAGLDLVAVDGDEVVGHVLAAVGQLDGAAALAVAPLAVTPARHGRGIGSALMGELLARADAAAWPVVLLLGNPAYYGRFGFVPAGSIGIVYAALGTEDPHFQARRLTHYDPGLRGTFAYCWELG